MHPIVGSNCSFADAKSRSQIEPQKMTNEYASMTRVLRFQYVLVNVISFSNCRRRSIAESILRRRSDREVTLRICYSDAYKTGSLILDRSYMHDSFYRFTSGVCQFLNSVASFASFKAMSNRESKMFKWEISVESVSMWSRKSPREKQFYWAS